MNEEPEETFIDLKDEEDVMDEDIARELFEKTLVEQGLKKNEEKMRKWKA